MLMRRLLTTSLAALFLGIASPVLAIPVLQLEIKNGVYDTATETTVATTKSFTLYAYLTPPAGETSALLADTYYIAAAITPSVSQSANNLGTFSFNGTTVRATADMVYGVPPFESYLGEDSGDLQKHGLYETYFKQFSFNFTSTKRATAYDVETSSASQPTANSSGGMYYMQFTVDTTALNPNYQIHFDLYSVKNGSSSGDKDIKKNAPFSHDAQSGKFSSGGTHATPEPASLLLLAGGLGTIAVVRHRRRSRG